MRQQSVRKHLQSWAADIPLKQKLVGMLVIGLSVTAAMSFVVIAFLSSSYNKMLYQTISESLSYSAKEITDYLEGMESLSEMILSDEKMQKEMAKLKQSAEEGAPSRNALYNLNVSVGAYYQNYADGVLKFISLYTPSATLKSNLRAADAVPSQLYEEVLRAADEKDGAPSWTDLCMDDYGLFLARNIRQIEGLRLDTLGTLLFNIDMRELVSVSTRFQGQYGESAYVIASGEQIIFCTDNLAPESLQMRQMSAMKDYDILRVGDLRYFVSRGRIAEYGWDYYCFVPYEKIGRQIEGIRRLCVVITALDLALVVYLTTVFTGRLTAHISRLRDRMQQFAQDGTRVPESGYDYSRRGDEIGALNRQFDEMSRKIIRLIQENYVNELLKKDAQFKALENQINPHFLYNTLDSIRWRAKSIGAQDISVMVESLSVLLRTSLRTRDEQSYTVGNEMEVVAAYITIQRLRYEERLCFINRIEPDFYGYSIPKMVLQPLVENAIFYGLERNVGECEIVLEAEAEEDTLHFYVRNTGSEMEDELLMKLEKEQIVPHGHGVGLLNIDKRVKIRYGSLYGLQLYNEDEYAVAELTLPMEKKQNREDKLP